MPSYFRYVETPFRARRIAQEFLASRNDEKKPGDFAIRVIGLVLISPGEIWATSAEKLPTNPQMYVRAAKSLVDQGLLKQLLDEESKTKSGDARKLDAFTLRDDLVSDAKLAFYYRHRVSALFVSMDEVVAAHEARRKKTPLAPYTALQLVKHEWGQLLFHRPDKTEYWVPARDAFRHVARIAREGFTC